MNKYQKIIDYDKHEAHYFCNENGIALEVSKDIIIDELQEEIKRQEKSQVILDNQNAELKDRINKALEYMKSEYTVTDDEVYLFLTNRVSSLSKLENILKGEDNE